MRQLLYIIGICALFASCSTKSKLTTSVKMPLDTEVYKTYENLNILVFAQSRSNRALIEDALEAQFESNGVNAHSTFTSFPLAGDRELLSNMGLGPEELKALIREKVKEKGIDGILTVSLLDKEQEERYVGGNVGFSMTVPQYSNPNNIYNYGFYDYYYYTYSTVAPGYYETMTTYFLEINLYDIETEQLLWTGQTSTKDPKNIREESEVFAKLVVDEIMRLNVVKP